MEGFGDCLPSQVVRGWSEPTRRQNHVGSVRRLFESTDVRRQVISDGRVK